MKLEDLIIEICQRLQSRAEQCPCRRLSVIPGGMCVQCERDLQVIEEVKFFMVPFSRLKEIDSSPTNPDKELNHG